MNIYKSDLWVADIDLILTSLPDLSFLENSSILITGAGGLICSAIIDVLIRYNETHDKKILLLVAGRDESKLRNRFFPYSEKSYFRSVLYDAGDRNVDIPIHADYIIHGAGNASPDKIIKEPVETMSSNFIGLLNLLEYAKKENTIRTLYISSSEVYGSGMNTTPQNEKNYGYIDILNSRNSYSVGKRAAETLCCSYTDEFQTDTVIVRPGHIYGPTASKNDIRVSSEWAYSAANGKDIVMKSKGLQIRSYVYCLDCATAILIALLKGVTKCVPYLLPNIQLLFQFLIF